MFLIAFIAILIACITSCGGTESDTNGNTGGAALCTIQDSFRCDGNMLQKCDREEWRNFQLCSGEQVCNQETKKCESKNNESGDSGSGNNSGNTDTVNTGDSGDTPEPPAACKLDAAYATSDAEAYFAFKGMGEINSRTVQQPSWANMVTATLGGVEGKDLDYADSYSFFMPTTIQNQNAIMLQAMGDPNMDSGRFTAAALAIIPIEYIDFMKENETDHLDQAPIVQVIDIAISKDEAYGKQCILAANKADESGQIALGKMQICYDKNEEFAVGETFKLSMAAELIVGEALVDFYQDVETADDLCNCYNMDTEEDVDCATIDEFVN